ncbi:hypothetical protein K7432_002368 [Basidiobolus ranarum]|uniref:HhH-GPD domain-containing protein n=1 Tax=Basidiobolus ranarum TaxID=34480 RepID=A0ABR2W858_9FUNG
MLPIHRGLLYRTLDSTIFYTMKEKGILVTRKSARLAGKDPVDKLTQVNTLNITFKQTKKSISPKKTNKKLPLLVKKEVKEVVTDKNEPIPSKPLFQQKFLDHSALKHLMSVDEKLGEFIKLCDGDCTILEAEECEVNGFQSLCKSIIYQQISGKAAASIMKKFILTFHPDTTTEDPMKLPFPSPQEVLDMEVEKLRSAGLSGRKVEYVKDLASKFLDGTVNEKKLREMDDETLATTLCSIKGIGPWTVHMFLMFNLKRLDILPVSDLGVRKAMSTHFGLKAPNGVSPSKKKSSFSGNTYLPTPKEMEDLSENWKPFRSVASWYMWRMTDMVIPE